MKKKAVEKLKQEILSAGIDIGTSTFHLIFSKLTLQKDPKSNNERYIISNREILYKSPIFLTPLKNGLIDYDQLSKKLKEEYQNFGVCKEDIDTGALIITGETARRKNAEDIVHLLSKDAGSFVVATAGPNLESILSAKGCGATQRSKINRSTILSIDIGGGTSNLAISKNGHVISTACINVGGRLIVTDKNDIIIRSESAAIFIAEILNIDITPGKILTSKNKKRISESLADSLIDYIKQDCPFSVITQKLSQTKPINSKITIDELIFSGGIAEYIYHNTEEKYNDIGKELAEAIENKIKVLNYKVTRPPSESPIRATVIGAGQYSLQISGSTSFLSANIKYPIQNLPVVPVNIDRKKLSLNNIKVEVTKALSMFDLDPNIDKFALAFKDPVRTIYEQLTIFAKGIEIALPVRVKEKKLFILIFDTDIGNSVGNVMKRETEIETILSIDELNLSQGDYIDIGKPIINDKIVPVVIKTLAFNKDF